MSLEARAASRTAARDPVGDCLARIDDPAGEGSATSP